MQVEHQPERGVAHFASARSRSKLDALLDDGTGKPRAELQPLADYICTQMNPRHAVDWLGVPEAATS